MLIGLVDRMRRNRRRTMELELVIFGQVMVFLTISLGTIMAVTAPRRPHPAPRSGPRAGTSYVPKRGM